MENENQITESVDVLENIEQDVVDVEEIENIEEVGKPLLENSIYNKETLFLRGANSNYIENVDELLIKKQFPNSEIQTLKNAGHWLHAENPKDFYNKVMNFISI